MKDLQKYFDISVFTSGHLTYAAFVITLLDPLNELIDHFYSREHTVFIPKLKLNSKDLALLKVDLRQSLLVDNCSKVCFYRPENLIPVVDFKGDSNDTHLLKLKEYLLTFVGCSDFRVKVINDLGLPSALISAPALQS